MTTAQLVRSAVAASLVVGAGLSITSILTMPDFSGDPAAWLREIAAAPGTSALSAVTFAVSQLLGAVGLLGVAHLLASRTPVLAPAGAVLVLLGAFGHAVYGGVNLTMLAMADGDPAALEVHAAAIDRVQSGPAVPFMAAGLLGTVLGFVLLAAAIWRGRLGPRWLGPAIVLWVLVEFVGSSFSEWAGHASGLLYVAVFVALTVEVWRSSPAHWCTAAESRRRTAVPA